jgi:hypothetical protein
VDGHDQAPPLGPFAWALKPEVAIRTWTSTSEWDYLDAICKHAGYPFTHRRRILFQKDRGWFLIIDDVEGAEGEHLVEQNWHSGCHILALGEHAFQFGQPGAARLLLDHATDCAVVESWRSPAYGVKVPGQSIVARRRTTLPMTVSAAIVDPSCSALAVTVKQDRLDTLVMVGSVPVRFPASESR